MAAKSNQEIERHYFELFRRIYPLPNGQVIYRDKPDIIIEGEKRLGIEVTIFYLERGELQQSEQNQRRIRKVVLERAQEMYIHKSGKFEINFSFNRDHPIMNIQKLTCKIVQKMFELEKASLTEGISGYYLKDIPELDFVYINPNLYINPKWRNDQSHIGFKTMSVDKIKQILIDKERKAEKYIKCGAYWLLLVIDSFDRAQEQIIPQKILNGEVKLASDVYEKIIIFQTAPEYVLELKA
jgi:hypothetical protein